MKSSTYLDAVRLNGNEAVDHKFHRLFVVDRIGQRKTYVCSSDMVSSLSLADWNLCGADARRKA